MSGGIREIPQEIFSEERAAHRHAEIWKEIGVDRDFLTDLAENMSAIGDEAGAARIREIAACIVDIAAERDMLWDRARKSAEAAS